MILNNVQLQSTHCPLPPSPMGGGILVDHWSKISSWFSQWLGRKTMLHISSINSLEHISFIFHGNALAISVSVIENFKVPICPSVPVTGISKSVFVPATKGSRMTSLHMSQYFTVSQYFPEYYQHCLIRHLQISLWGMIRQLLSQCLFWERTHFPSISHYSQIIIRILPSDILGMFQMG